MTLRRSIDSTFLLGFFILIFIFRILLYIIFSQFLWVFSILLFFRTFIFPHSMFCSHLSTGFVFHNSVTREMCDTTGDSDYNVARECVSCGSSTPPFWRRHAGNQYLCHACAVYYKSASLTRSGHVRPQRRIPSPVTPVRFT